MAGRRWRLWAVMAALIAGSTFGPVSAAPAQQPDDGQLAPPLSGELIAEPQIVGGRPAEPGQLPWQVALVLTPYVSPDNYYDGQFCGGSLIAAGWILTAAHCMVYALEDIGVVAGATNLANPSATTQFSTVVRRIVHPGYNATTYENDLALLQLAAPFTPGAAVAPIGLVSAADDATGTAPGRRALVSGWGSTVQQDPDFSLPPSYPPRLQFTTVPIVDNALCDAQLAVDIGYSGFVKPSMLCAGLADGGRDACQADSGGPLVVRVNGEWQQAGIVSTGVGCAWPELPGVYTRVSTYLRWISRQVGEALTPPSVLETVSCGESPDIAVDPQFIPLGPGGTTTLTVTLRNTNPTPYGTADLLVSLADGLHVAAAVDGLDLGGRAAWQQISLAVNQTRQFALHVAADEHLPTAPIFVVELYCAGGVQSRIDGVMLDGAQYLALSGLPASVEAVPPIAVPQLLPDPPPPTAGGPAEALPQQLPATAVGRSSGPLPIGALLLVLLGLLLRRLQG